MKTKINSLVAGICLGSTTLSAAAAVRYVDVNSASPTPPYTNWATAATNIQDAIDVAVAGDEIVVTNGVYQNGGRAVGTNLLVNRVAVEKPLTVRSVNGPEVTVIRGHKVPEGFEGLGDGAVRCVYLTNGAALLGFTLTNGATRLGGVLYSDHFGGGVWCESASAVVSNCVLSGNAAFGGGGAYSGTLNNCALSLNVAEHSGGGGAAGGTLNTCILSNNSAGFGGGGASGSVLNNCALTGNSAAVGGGAIYCILNNCTLLANAADRHYRFGVGFVGGGVYDSTLNNCTLTGNSASRGGGAHGGTLNNCTLVGNSAEYVGGGAYEGTLNNCTLTGNSAHGLYGSGGGAYYCTLNNCIVYFNSARVEGDNYGAYSTLNYCCTTPLPTNGVGNLSAEPKLASASHLNATSPCINAFAPDGPDLDGNLRISGGIVDIGAYEFQFNRAPSAVANVSPLFAISPNETNRFILAPNNANAAVVLDGSQSSDVDNDSLQFFWYADGQTNVLATGAVSTQLFAVGPHTVRLVVGDGRDTGTAQVNFEVITPGMAVGQLMVLVDEANLQKRHKQPLIATLKIAKAAFDRGKLRAGVSLLRAFQHKVRAQIARHDPALATEFTAASQKINAVVSRH